MRQTAEDRMENTEDTELRCDGPNVSTEHAGNFLGLFAERIVGQIAKILSQDEEVAKLLK